MLERYAREAVDLSRQFHDRYAEGQAWRHVAYAESRQERYEPALEDYFKARHIFSELKERDDETAVKKKISDLFAVVFSVFSDLDRALEYYKKSLVLSRQDEDPAATAKNLHNIASIYRARGDFRQALPLYREALQLNDRLNALSDCGTILSSLSDAALKTGDSAASMKYMRQALAFYEKKSRSQASARAFSQKGISSMEQNDFSEALNNLRQALAIHKIYSEPGRTINEMQHLGRLYSRFHHEAQAQEYFRQAQELRQQQGDHNEIIGAVLAQASARQKQNDLAGAEALLLFCENRAIQKHLQKKLGETYLQWSSLYKLRRDPVNALYYQTLGNKTRDGLPSTAIQAGMQQLIASHESGREIDKIKGQKRRLTIIGMLAIGLLLALIGVLAWKQKSIRKWVRDHLSSKDQQLQKKMTQLQELGRKLDRLQETPSPGACAPPATGDGPSRECLQLVLRHMQKDRIFLDSELTLKKMAAKVGANTSSLSRMLNQDLGMGFSDFINHFRIEEAKKIMRTDEQNKWDVIDICFEVGFNSMSSFYRIFKRHTGMTPAEFQQAGKK